MSCLRKHERAIHLNIKFSCPFCDKKYNQREGLNYHILAIHKNVKYKCESCNFIATHKRTLNKHVRRTHSDTPIETNAAEHEVIGLTTNGFNISST